MELTYDPEVDALYVRFVDESIEVTTHRLTEDVAVDYAPDGRVVGLEVLDASEHVFGTDAEKRVTLHNLKPIVA
jgi:uncharacterized protein YuzE